MIECPGCRRELPDRAVACNACGFEFPKGTDNTAAASDPLRWNCADVFRGQRCSNLGTMSPSTTGSGPWYCAQHMPGLRDFDRNAEAARSNLPAAKRLATPRAFDFEAAVERTAIQTEPGEA